MEKLVKFILMRKLTLEINKVKLLFLIFKLIFFILLHFYFITLYDITLSNSHEQK